MLYARGNVGGLLMYLKRPPGSLFTISIMTMALSCAVDLARAQGPFVMTSTTFKDGTMMPKRTSNKPPPNPNCVGDNVSPQLSWKGTPEGTRSYALTMSDPEGFGGQGVVHWIAYGIPLNVTSFAEGEVSKASNKFIGGTSTQGTGTYSGPCTPPGSPHHYTFLVIATDLEPTALPPGLTFPELQARLAGHFKGATALVGLF